MVKTNSKLSELLFIFCSGFIFIFPALWNGFPLVTPDTGTYIYSGFVNSVPNDRPVFYSYFIRFVSMRDSLWFVAYAQGIITAWIIGEFIRNFSPKYSAIKFRLLIFSLLAFLTTLPWITSQIMADAFSACWILTIPLLLFSKQSTVNRIFTIILFLFSSMVHNSFMSVNVLLVLILSIYWLRKSTRHYFNSRNMILFICLVLMTWIISPTVNFLVDKKYRVTGSPHVFLMARFAESGILKAYLDMKCTWIKDLTKIEPTSLYIISALHSYSVLDIKDGGSENGETIQQNQYKNNPNQHFRIKKNSDDLYTIVANSGKVLSAETPIIVNGTAVVIATDTGGTGQRFLLERVKEGNYIFRIPGTNKVIDVEGGNKNNHAKIHLWEKIDDKATNQIFRLTKADDCLFCIYSDIIPKNTGEYIWDSDYIFFNRTGDWLGSKKLYNDLLFDILTTPKFFFWFIRESVISTFRQVIQVELGGFGQTSYDSPPGFAIRNLLPRDVNQFKNSRQVLGYKDIQDANKRILFMMALTLLVLGIYFFRPTPNPQTKIIILLFIIILVLNAFITGALANVLDRLQSRLSWSIPFLGILIGLEMITSGISKFSGRNN